MSDSEYTRHFDHTSTSACLPSRAFQLTPEPTLYVDEKKGSDSTGKGTESAPFVTPVAAYLSLNPSTESDKDPLSVVNILVRKPAEGDAPESWSELSGAGKKKLAKGVDVQRKKAAKLAADGERLEKERKEQEARDKKRREEAAQVKIAEPEGKADFVSPNGAGAPDEEIGVGAGTSVR